MDPNSVRVLRENLIWALLNNLTEVAEECLRQLPDERRSACK